MAEQSSFITLKEAKQFCQVYHDADDDLLNMHIAAAEQFIATVLGVKFDDKAKQDEQVKRLALLHVKYDYDDRTGDLSKLNGAILSVQVSYGV